MPEPNGLFEAIRAGELATVKSVVGADARLASARNDSGVSAVLTAVYIGRNEIRDYLIASGAALELPEAAALGHLVRVRELVEENPASANSFSPDGFPVVALAAFLGRLEVVQYLAAHGADINSAATNGSGYNALTGAVTSGHTAVAQWLLEHGANANYRYSTGYSPLLTAAANGHVDIAQLLLAHGADPHATTNDGKSPLSLSIERNHPEVAALFQARAST
ncbi:MAG TPA: ankyrin repeat domain-containing protein [Candidatus Limnocylindrales bacterium]|nr:ankyrin repeat domain-containing protein [Candidatus Limnocylindrales bacterium]